MTVLAGNVHKVFWEANGVFENTQYSNRNMIFEHNPLVCIYIYRYKSVFQLDYIYLFLSKQLGDINIPWALAPGSREKKKALYSNCLAHLFSQVWCWMIHKLFGAQMVDPRHEAIRAVYGDFSPRGRWNVRFAQSKFRALRQGETACCGGSLKGGGGWWLVFCWKVGKHIHVPKWWFFSDEDIVLDSKRKPNK